MEVWGYGGIGYGGMGVWSVEVGGGIFWDKFWDKIVFFLEGVGVTLHTKSVPFFTIMMLVFFVWLFSMGGVGFFTMKICLIQEVYLLNYYDDVGSLL